MRLPAYAVGVVLLVVIGCSDRAGIQRSADDPFLQAPSHTAYNVKILFTDSSRTKAVLYGRQGTIDERSNTTMITGAVVVDFYDRSGRAVEARLTADSVVVDDRSKNMTAYGAVRVVSEQRRVSLTTTQLDWVQSTSRVRTESPVHIETGTESIDGMGFESNQDLTSYRLFQVRGVRRKS
jgi:LPS export ABC transporter protein LptC